MQALSDGASKLGADFETRLLILSCLGPHRHPVSSLPQAANKVGFSIIILLKSSNISPDYSTAQLIPRLEVLPDHCEGSVQPHIIDKLLSVSLWDAAHHSCQSAPLNPNMNATTLMASDKFIQ